MPAPAFWKGYLKLSLVTCPVTLTPATTESEKVRFHTINAKTGRRVRSRYVDAETGKPVKDGDEVKGYETEDGAFVTFDDEELESVALESVRTIDIETFVAADEIPWVWLDRPYFVTPSDKVGAEAYAVIRAAMDAGKVVGISRLVMWRREHAVMLEPRGKGIVLWTLRYGNEVRDSDAYFGGIADTKPSAKMLSMIQKLVGEHTAKWTPKLVHDPVQDELKALIAAKKKKGGKTAAKPAKNEPDGRGASNVVNLMDALKTSLERAGSKAK